MRAERRQEDAAAGAQIRGAEKKVRATLFSEAGESPPAKSSKQENHLLPV